jgi:hypothetical protein
MTRSTTNIFLIIALLAQITFWHSVKDIKPNLKITPEIPTPNQTEAFSLGDHQAYFRLKTLDLQMAGDTFGRTTALKDYNFPLLKEWFFFLDTLDSKSNFAPSIAAYYFSRTQNPPDVIYTLDYLEAHADKDPSTKWWWYSQAIYLANSVLGDKERALQIAKKLRVAEGDLPLWARQMEVFIQEDLGNKDTAEAIMCEVLSGASEKEMSEMETNFIVHFFKERMRTIGKEFNQQNLKEGIAQVQRRCAYRQIDGSI